MRQSRLPVIAVGILFLLSLLGVILGFSIPTKVERTVIQTTYKMEGKLALTALGQILTLEEQQKKSAQGKYFASLVEAIDIGYKYQFVPDRPATGPDVEQVQISAIMESTGLWEKEVVLVPQTQYRGGADLTFRLNMASLQDLASRISRELGVGNPSPYIILKAKVQVDVPTDGGPLSDTYTQTIRVGVVGSTLEWSSPLESTRKGYYKGLAYDHQGAFSYSLYLKPSLAFGTVERDQGGSFALAGQPPTVATKTPDPVFFTKIVDSMDVSYRYEFLAKDMNSESDAQITAVLENAGLWRKEVVLVPLATYTSPFTINIPLDVAALQSEAANINKELGVSGILSQFVLKATVHTRAQTAGGVREADFVETTTLIPGTNTLTWQRGLTKSGTADWEGVTYEQKGNFDYTIRLKDNILFGPVTLRPDKESLAGSGQGTEKPLPSQVLTSPTASVDAPKPLAAAKTYQKDSVERIDGKFDFPFTADPPAGKLTQEVEITGELKGARWQETLTLVPQTPFSKDSTVAFSLDVPLLYAIIGFNQQQHQESAASWDLVLSARVHAKADTAFGPINDQLTQSLTLKLGGTEISWPDTTPQVKEGDIHRTALRPNSSASTARMGSLGLAGMVGVALAFVVWNYIEARRRRLSELESEALQMKRKSKELLLDIEDLPQKRDGTLVELSSLEAVIKTSEALLKPILHVARTTKHTYAVFDNAIWYVYVHEIAESPPEPGTPAENSS